jgi:hypothetical protein
MPARTHLLAETGGGTVLAIQCWSYLEEFIRDQGEGPLEQAFGRFIGWSRPRGT